MKKTEFTDLVLKRLDQQSRDSLPPQYFHTGLWWRNPNPQSLRLSNLGYEIFSQHSGLEKHSYHGTCRFHLSTVLKIDRQISNPHWYNIDSKNNDFILLLFGNSSEIFWLTLYNDIDLFLQHYNTTNN